MYAHRSPEQHRHRKPVSRRSPSSYSESDYSDDHHRRPSSTKKRKRYSDSFDRPPSPASKRPRYLDRLPPREETSRNQRSRSRSASPNERGHLPSKRRSEQSPGGAADANKKKQEKKIEKKYLKKRQSILEGTLTPTSKDKALRKLEKKKDKKMKKILSGSLPTESNDETQGKVSFVRYAIDPVILIIHIVQGSKHKKEKKSHREGKRKHEVRTYS